MKQPDLFADDATPQPGKGQGVAPPPVSPPAPPSNGDSDAPLAQYAEIAYLQYAVSVVKGRALPDICDGQKPVQRRILYAMSEMSLGPTAKPVKSARVVGDVLGKYHPHGDTAAYDALVRVAQEFSLRYPLIDGQGNFGSADGDPPAAMRYTECRLTAIASLLLSELDEGTVDFVPNYDGAFQEPSLLPARLPFSLLNGASGIAVGMSTEMPSHNLKEVAAACVLLAEKPNASLDDIMTALPGPDFPVGGQIISSPAELREVYATGRGAVKVRARWNVEELARGQWQLVFTALPPQTSARKVLEEIEELTNPKVRLGKKSLSTEQTRLKQLILASLDRVRDESGRDDPMRLVFEPKSKNQDPQAFAQLLLAHTSLEGNVSTNFVAIGRDGRPAQKPLIAILQEWIDFRLDTLRRRTEFRLGQVRDRLHILEGRSIVLLNIDKVIRIIRQADDPKADLIAAFKLSERQAEDILDIRLRQLARLEAIKIEQEMKDLGEKQSQLEKLLAKPAALRAQLVKEIKADAAQFGDARRTLIEASEKAVVTVPVIDEPVTVILSQRGWIRARQGHDLDPITITFKEGDALLALRQCRTVDSLVLVASNGRMYTLQADSLPGGRGDGVAVSSLVDLPQGTRIIALILIEPGLAVLLATRNGMGLVCSPEDLISRTRAGKQFVNLDADDTLVTADIYDPAQARSVATVSEQGKLLVFPIAEAKRLANGGKGVILMGLDSGDGLAGAVTLGHHALALGGTGRGGKWSEIRLTQNQLDEFAGKRARKGKRISSTLKPKVVGRG